MVKQLFNQQKTGVFYDFILLLFIGLVANVRLIFRLK